MDLLDKLYSKNKPAIEREMALSVPRNKEPAEVYGLIWEFLDLGGKRFRPLLCLTAARAACVGRMPEAQALKSALPAAAAIELFHNFTLIHDDIEDASFLRRGKPCLHVRYGLPLAINAGDGLFMMVLKATLRIEEKKRWQAQGWLVDALTSVLEGQAIELSWYRNKTFDLTEKDYERMAGGKTAALIEASTKVGAYLGGGDEAAVNSLARYGRLIGLAFQIQDDVLNLVGNEKDYKKEIGGDIREGKRTVMVIHALSHLAPSDAKKLKQILSSQKAGKDEIAWAIQKMEKSGSIRHASGMAARLVNDAVSSLSILPSSGAKSELERIAKYIISRLR